MFTKTVSSGGGKFLFSGHGIPLFERISSAANAAGSHDLYKYTKQFIHRNMKLQSIHTPAPHIPDAFQSLMCSAFFSPAN